MPPTTIPTLSPAVLARVSVVLPRAALPLVAMVGMVATDEDSPPKTMEAPRVMAAVVGVLKVTTEEVKELMKVPGAMPAPNICCPAASPLVLAKVRVVPPLVVVLLVATVAPAARAAFA